MMAVETAEREAHAARHAADSIPVVARAKRKAQGAGASCPLTNRNTYLTYVKHCLCLCVILPSSQTANTARALVPRR